MSRPCWGIFLATLTLFACFFGSAFPLYAQTQENSGRVDESTLVLSESLPGAPAPSGGSSVFIVLRMVLVLALAALAIYGVVFFIKRLARPREIQDPHLKVLARVPLGNDAFAAVISVGAKGWLVAGGSGGINLISEIDDPESLETMLLEETRKTHETGTRGFIDFRSLLGRFGKNPRTGNDLYTGQADGSANDSRVESLRKQRERLRGL